MDYRYQETRTILLIGFMSVQKLFNFVELHYIWKINLKLINFITSLKEEQKLGSFFRYATIRLPPYLLHESELNPNICLFFIKLKDKFEIKCFHYRRSIFFILLFTIMKGWGNQMLKCSESFQGSWQQFTNMTFFILWKEEVEKL